MYACMSICMYVYIRKYIHLSMCTNVISRAPGSAASAEEMEEFSASYYKKHSIEFSRSLNITMGDFSLKGKAN